MCFGFVVYAVIDGDKAYIMSSFCVYISLLFS